MKNLVFVLVFIFSFGCASNITKAVLSGSTYKPYENVSATNSYATSNNKAINYSGASNEWPELSNYSSAFKNASDEWPDLSNYSSAFKDSYVDIHSNIPYTHKRNKNAIGVIIGNKSYSNKDVPNVDFALNDAQYMKKYLVQTLGYDEGNIIYIENATQTDFITIFGNEQNHKGKLYDWVKENQSDVFVYYVGHGAPNPENKNATLFLQMLTRQGSI